MADTKLSAIGTQLTAPVYNDRLFAVDDPGGTPADRYLHFGQLQLAITAVKTGAYSPNAGELVPCDVSATGANADIELTLPAAPTAGDTIGYFVEEEHASHTYNVDLVAAGATINGASYTGAAAGKWSLWIDGELLILRYINADIGWLVVHDGRIPTRAVLYETSTADTLSSGWNKLTVSTAGTDNMSCTDTANSKIEVKRGGEYFLRGAAMSDDIDSGFYIRAGVAKSAAPAFAGTGPYYWSNAASAIMQAVSFGLATVTAADDIMLYCYTTDTTSPVSYPAINTQRLEVLEVLS